MTSQIVKSSILLIHGDGRDSFRCHFLHIQEVFPALCCLILLKCSCWYKQCGSLEYKCREWTFFARHTYNLKRFLNLSQDADGNPVNNHQIILYDAGTRIKSDSWYDVNNEPVIGPNGYARMEIEYVGKTQSQVSYYDELGNLLFYKKAGYARMEREFDGTRVTAVRYYGADGEMTVGPDGYACAKYSYFANQRKRTMYYTAEGNLYST